MHPHSVRIAQLCIHAKRRMAEIQLDLDQITDEEREVYRSEYVEAEWHKIGQVETWGEVIKFLESAS